VVKHFAKKQKEAKTMVNEEDVKGNLEMTEGKNEISIKYIDVIAGGLRHQYAVSERITSYSRFNGKSEIFV
jgi:hypothetical protein